MAVLRNEWTQWSEPESRLLMDQYETYMKNVGPMKEFKNKKAMWLKISQDIEAILGQTKNWSQCETRYKTIKKRKRYVDGNNKTSSRSARNLQEAINEIYPSNDDSCEAEVLRGINKAIINKNQKCNPRKKRSDPLSATLIKIHEAKEAGKERRHREKMELLERLFSSKND